MPKSMGRRSKAAAVVPESKGRRSKTAAAAAESKERAGKAGPTGPASKGRRKKAVAAADLYELYVDFNGMCLFVPEPGAKRMHVLMPNLPMDMGSMPRHVTRIIFDAAHLSSTATQPLDVPLAFDLERVFLELPGTGSSSALPDLASSIVHIDQYMKEKIPPGHLKHPEATKKVGVRVTLTAGVCGRPEKALEWYVEGMNPGTGGPKQGLECLTNAVRWLAGKQSGPLPLVIKSLDSDDTEVTMTLYPLGTGADRNITIRVYHLPLSELPPAPPDPRKCEDWLGKNPSHFHGFDKLFTGPIPKITLHACQCTPKSRSRRSRSHAADAARVASTADSGSLLTCMMASSAL